METNCTSRRLLIGLLSLTSLIIQPIFAQQPTGSSLFTGNGAYVVVPHNDSLNTTNNQLTVECWFKRNAPPITDWNSLVSKDANSDYWEYNGWNLRFLNLSPRGDIYIDCEDPVAIAVIAGNGNPTAEDWHHYAMQFDGTNYLVWIDGFLNFETNAPGHIINNTNPINIGSQFSGWRAFNGWIDEVRISNVPRYANTFVPQTRFEVDSNTVALYHFDEAQGTVVTDSSSNGNNGAIQGTNAWSSDVPEPVFPSFVVQPQTQTATVGDNVTLSAAATGGQPLSYQWILNSSTALVGETNLSLTLTNVQLSNNGSFYSVVVTNAYGSITSSNAQLTVIGQGPGQTGSSLFTGDGAYVVVPHNDSLNTTNNQLTVECWFKRNAPPITDWNSLVSKDANSDYWEYNGWNLRFLNLSPRGDIYIDYEDPVAIAVIAGNGNPTAEDWHHYAMQFDGTNYLVWIDGFLNFETNAPGHIINNTNPINIGSQFSGWRAFNGWIDEVRISNVPRYTNTFVPQTRFAVDSNTVALYHFDEGQGTVVTDSSSNGNNGAIQGTDAWSSDVPVSTPPSFVVQPQTQTATVGDIVTLSAAATGSQPLSYQWILNSSTVLVGETNSSLTLTNVQLSDNGSYSIVVTNAYGSITSSNAQLTVIGQGPTGSSLFTGDGAYVVVPHNDSLNTTNNQLTVECWFKQNAVPETDWNSVVSKEGYSYDLNGWGLRFNGLSPRGVFCIDFQDIGINDVIPSEAGHGTPTMGDWHHYAMQFDGTNYLVWIDGSLNFSTNIPGQIVNNSNPITIGCESSGWRAFNGWIDEVRISNVPRYTNNFTPQFHFALDANTVALYHFDEGQGTVVTDSSSNGNNGAIQGVDAWSSDVPGPVRPSFVVQPQTQIATVGDIVTLSAAATGSHPLSYQWILNSSTILAGATNSSLTLTNVQLSDNGSSYSVVVMNAYGSITSSNAQLMVCIPVAISAPDGLVAWWQAEDNTCDLIGLNTGIAQGGLAFTNGEVGQAFSFNGNDAAVKIPTSTTTDIGAGVGFTIEFWINPADVSSWHSLTEWNNSSKWGTYLWIFPNPGQLTLDLIDTTGGERSISSVPNMLATNVFQHVAATYDKASGVACIYYNGALAISQYVGSFTPQTSYDLYLGSRPTGQDSSKKYNGLMDEMSLYDRALSGSEIQSLFNAHSAGKVSKIAPLISTQPQSQSVSIGSSLTLSVDASGSGALCYQWTLNGSAIPGATNRSLTLASVQSSDTGIYQVSVTNPYGTAISSNATVSIASSTLQIPSISARAGSIIDVPIQLLALGNENSAGFSLNFNPSLLSFVSATAGSSVQSWQVMFNSASTASGQLGVIVGLNSQTPFPAGTREIAVVRFKVATVSASSTTSIVFGGSPVELDVEDTNSATLNFATSNGSVTISPVAYEGDVSSPIDNKVKTADWSRIGRFVAGLENPASPQEFQRADCAPRITLGDGKLTVADWVQAGRYAVASDSLTPAGGPIGPVNRPFMKAKASAANETVRLISITPIASTGKTRSFAVQLAAQGNETALGFSLSFDPTVLKFVQARLGSGAPNAALNVNSNSAATGRLGFVLGLSSGAFPSGSQQMIQVDFASRNYVAKNASISFGSLPVALELADTNANILSISSPGIVMDIPALPLPALNITNRATGVLIKWPLAADGFVLESSDCISTNWKQVTTPAHTNDPDIQMTVPPSTGARFFRLKLNQ